MRTREEILETIRILEIVFRTAGEHGDVPMVLITQAQIGVLKWAIEEEPQSGVFQATIEGCRKHDAAQAKARVH